MKLEDLKYTGTEFDWGKLYYPTGNCKRYRTENYNSRQCTVTEYGDLDVIHMIGARVVVNSSGLATAYQGPRKPHHRKLVTNRSGGRYQITHWRTR